MSEHHTPFKICVHALSDSDVVDDDHRLHTRMFGEQVSLKAKAHDCNINLSVKVTVKKQT
jgi:hypothetical protein